MAEWLDGHGVELVVCAGYMHLLTPAFLDRFPSGRQHPPRAAARLPRRDADRGRARRGRPETGVTVHYVDEGVDTGP